MSVDRSSPWAVMSLVLLAIAMVFTTGALWQIFQQLPCFEKMFAEMGMTLPVLTQFCLSPYLPGILIGLALLSIAKEIVGVPGKLRLVLSASHVLLVLVLRELYVQGMFMPLIELMRTMGGSR